jgi:hypothetical protein
LIVIYTPDGGEPEQYDARSLLSSEASIVERAIDMKWPEIKDGLRDEDLNSMRGIVWILKKRHNPTLRFGDFDPGVDEMVTRFDRREIEEYVANAQEVVSANPDATGADIAEALSGLEVTAADPEHALAVIQAVADGPKAPGPEDEPGTEETHPPTLPSSETSTSGSSPTFST